jgi:hypothetical protein
MILHLWLGLDPPVHQPVALAPVRLMINAPDFKELNPNARASDHDLRAQILLTERV